MESFSTLPPVRLPEQVYMPVTSADPDGDEVRFELRQAADGEVLAPVYSSLATMIHCCGDYQPWLLLPAQRLLELQRAFDVDRIVLDLSLPPGERHRPEGRSS
ncbi:MAG: SAV_915 family protein [Pseudonocardiaceae bacterium]